MNTEQKDTGILQNIDPTKSPSFTLRNRMRRVVWACVYHLLFRPSPRPLHAWRASLLRRMGADLASGVHVYPTAEIWAPWNLEMHEASCLGPKVNCYNVARVRIGEKAIISQGTHLCTASHDYDDPLFQLIAAPIHVGAHAWVAAECFIGPGVQLGEGALLAARAVVTRSVPEWTIWAGNPAQFKKARAKPGESPVTTNNQNHSERAQ